ncbi:hypothetical protein IMG5_193120 [Ichthyophthirius multifiliis]|uniref:Uncharacterized protein n=1 Tax=Ichthyophthirius multifiliis TaxID=5932 RepID=G0R4I5_ICHMU|nr:hypothetical protein IMG5_193120 [Ichthyophthirius multifiliis]EGR27613.1 hypothetical protein IMG5_193120 [Ichthyophthirius multifiliis]|eukprot:XP_004025065.1 hypothetical protein IMG5_193120 [Ichthyophthirius multifiliis]
MKEKRKVLDIYKQQIVQDFDTLYEKDTEKKIITKLQNLEKKQKLQQELKRNESILSNELKSYNTIKYEIKKKKQEYDNLLNQLNNCDFVFTQEKDRNELEKLKQTQEDLVQKLNDSQNIQMSLKHMSDTRKKLILFEKKQVEQLYEEYQKQSLEAHKNFMEQTIQELKEFQVYFQSQIDNQKQQNQQKKSLLENLKFVQNQRRASISIQEKDVEKSEKILIQENSKLQEAQQKVRRLEKIIDQICLVQSRINYQLQPKNLKNKNAEVKREELIDQITLSGLKLEKIVAFLAKKKDPQRVESINTDADYHKPPEYIGINPLNYTKYWENQNINNLNEDKFMFQQNENDEDQYQNTIRKQILVNNNNKGFQLMTPIFPLASPASSIETKQFAYS